MIVRTFVYFNDKIYHKFCVVNDLYINLSINKYSTCAHKSYSELNN